MKRVLLSLLCAAGTAGCTGIIPGSDDDSFDETPEEAAARTYFETQAYPTLSDASCVSCHATTAGVSFLAGAPDVTAAYQSIRAFDPPVLNTDAPGSSRVLTKGAHSGPALTAEQSSVLLQWATLEEAALPDDPNAVVLETTPLSLLVCTAGEPGDATCPVNTIDLAPIGATGSTVTFTVENLASGVYLSDLKLNGDATNGIYIEHPLFISWEDENTKIPDDIDRFFDTKMNLMPATQDFIDGGTAAFMTFARSKPISITFKAISAYSADNGGGTDTGGGGCKVVDQFTALAQPQLNSKCAGPCHAGGNANAKNAVDMSLMSDTSTASQQTACNEILSRVNKNDIENSGILLAPDPDSGIAHSFKDTDFANFRDNAIVPWATLERDAP